MVCQFATVDAAGLLQSARYGSMTNTKAAVAQPPALSKAHPLANRKILKELAIFKPMGTFALETMQIWKPSLIRSPTRSGGNTSFLPLTSRRSMISSHVPLLLLWLESIWHLR
jgi:hypothetical protein